MPPPNSDINDADALSHGRWLVGTRSGEAGAGSWGSTDGWEETRETLPHAERAGRDAFPIGTLIDSNMNHIRQDLRMASLTWNGRPDRPAHLDGENSDTWARIQLYACSLAAQRCHAAFPTFTGPQIEARLASIEEELTARKREHAKRSQETEELWVAYQHAADEFREVERRVEELDETLKFLQDLRAIALIYFPPVPGQT